MLPLSPLWFCVLRFEFCVSSLHLRRRLPLAAPASDPDSKVPISRADKSKYKVEANIPYGPLPAQRLDIIYPTTAGPTHNVTLPGVVMFHGGGWIHSEKATMSSFYNRFLAHGFLVCNVEYRIGDLVDGKVNPNGALAPAAVTDSLLAAKWFWDHADYYHFDKSRYVVTGASAGGHLALMVGMATSAGNFGPTNPNDFKIAAIVNGYGPTDIPDLFKRKTSFALQWLPEGTPNRDDLAKRLSPITYVRKDIPPLLTTKDSKDTTVPVEQNQRLTKALKENRALMPISTSPRGERSRPRLHQHHLARRRTPNLRRLLTSHTLASLNMPAATQPNP